MCGINRKLVGWSIAWELGECGSLQRQQVPKIHDAGVAVARMVDDGGEVVVIEAPDHAGQWLERRSNKGVGKGGRECELLRGRDCRSRTHRWGTDDLGDGCRDHRRPEINAATHRGCSFTVSMPTRGALGVLSIFTKEACWAATRPRFPVPEGPASGLG